MNKKRRLIGRIPGILLLTMLMLVMMGAAVSQVYAEGENTLEGKFTVNGVDLEPTTFTLYKVGHFERDTTTGKSYLALDSEVGQLPVDVTVDLSIEKEDYKDAEDPDAEWTEAWMTSAKTLADYIETDAGLVEKLSRGTAVTDGDGVFSFSGLENGLYLITGTRQKIEGTDGNSTYYWPRPMLVMVLNGSVNGTTRVEPKPGSENVKDFMVRKDWAKDELVKPLRPDGIDVEIYYGDELQETINLNELNHWSYSWETNKVEQEWRCIEKLTEADAANYYVTTTETYSGDTAHGSTKIITLTNTYERYDLSIVKNTPVYIQHSEQVSTAVVFDLTGKNADGKTVWHTQAGMSISGPGEETITVKNVPRNLAELWVKEIYTGNYKPDQGENGKKAELIAGDDNNKSKYVVSFQNTYDGPPSYDGGVVNKMEDKDGKYKITERKGLKTEE